MTSSHILEKGKEKTEKPVKKKKNLYQLQRINKTKLRAVQRHQHQFSFLWSQMINNLRRWDLRAWTYVNSSTLYRAWKSNSKIGHIFFYREWLTRPSRNVKNLEINKIGGASSFGNNTVGRTIDTLSEKKLTLQRFSHKVWEKEKEREKKA